MNTGRRQTALLVVVLVLPALLAFGVVRVLGTRDGGKRQADPPPPTNLSSPSNPVGPSGGVDSSGVPASDSGPAVDVAARITGTVDGTELTFQVTRDLAEAGPPPQVDDCRRFAEWAQRNGGIPVGFEPVHTLSVHARRNLDVNGVSARVVPVGEVQLSEQDGPFVELACRDGTPAPTTTRSSRAGEEDGESVDRPHVLTAGQTVELPLLLEASYDTDEVFPHGVVDYQLKVHIGIDGVSEEHLLRNATAPFRCCGRLTYMGFQAARYEWRLSPARSLRYCAELRYTTEPPPERCEIRQR
ncbi:hypothetical protein [Micromonospora sp. WMMD987]|jgi:hypothetical protein|uniref:hypothetical protein n=1 Tax=Micromonospora TaxID=1873 RepID=UPI00249BD931|nr:hypothetical protein [Micromonospora sp. WMMD987]WFE95780.1 hypothetical protein O7612_02270 [Micromonospora sp. WMMD987]